MSSHPTDRNGFLYEDLLKTQADHLGVWATKLRMEVRVWLEDYVTASNRPAQANSEKHRVFRGQDLVQLIISHPDIPVGYPPLPVVVEEVI